eukprot:878582-Pyramimonas_sp.AAC.2
MSIVCEGGSCYEATICSARVSEGVRCDDCVAPASLLVIRASPFRCHEDFRVRVRGECCLVGRGGSP